MDYMNHVFVKIWLQGEVFLGKRVVVTCDSEAGKLRQAYLFCHWRVPQMGPPYHKAFLGDGWSGVSIPGCTLEEPYHWAE